VRRLKKQRKKKKKKKILSLRGCYSLKKKKKKKTCVSACLFFFASAVFSSFFRTLFRGVSPRSFVARFSSYPLPLSHNLDKEQRGLKENCAETRDYTGFFSERTYLSPFTKDNRGKDHLK
jgi:hypothetical protein